MFYSPPEGCCLTGRRVGADIGGGFCVESDIGDAFIGGEVVGGGGGVVGGGVDFGGASDIGNS